MSSIEQWARSIVDLASLSYDVEYGGVGGENYAEAFFAIWWPVERKVTVIPTGFGLSGERGTVVITYSSEGAAVRHWGRIQVVPLEQVVSSRFIPGAQIFASTSKQKTIAWLTAVAGG